LKIKLKFHLYLMQGGNNSIKSETESREESSLKIDIFLNAFEKKVGTPKGN